MDSSLMLKQMCHEILSAADIKAICQARGFSNKGFISPDHLETLFLSDKGVEPALAQLTHDEIVLLHVLTLKNDAVDLTFFKDIYADKSMYIDDYGYTFTKRYMGVFKIVKTSLLRRGLLLIGIANSWRAKTKMERYRFMFPQEFSGLLPCPFTRTMKCNDPGDFKEDVIRPRFINLLSSRTSDPGFDDKKYELALDGGELLIGGRKFRAGYCREWIEDGWEHSVVETKKEIRKKMSPVKFMIYALSRLKPQEWASHGEASSLFKRFPDVPEKLDIQRFFEAGWEWGCLAKQEIEGEVYYRAPEEIKAGETKVENCLEFNGNQPVRVDIKTIPYQSLEALASISHLEVTENRLETVPDFIKIGKASDDMAKLPVIDLLKRRSPLFSQAFIEAEKRKGKQIVHENLMLARVTDLGLRVKLEKSYEGKIVVLSDEYIAFPNTLFPDVKKIVEKSGHVIKTEKAK